MPLRERRGGSAFFRARGWLVMLVCVGFLTQTSLNVVRPVTSYKLIALGSDGVVLGIVTASYALLPLVAAVPAGRLADRSSNLRGVTLGSVAALTAGSVMIAVADGVYLLEVGTIVLGVGHLLFSIGGQAMVARRSEDGELDAGFGWFTASYSGGQAIGPLIGGALIGSGSVQNAQRLGDINLALWAGVAVTALALPLFLSKQLRPATVRTVRTRERTSATNAPVGRILSIRQVSSAIFAATVMMAAGDILSAFLPLVGEEAGISPFVVGWLLAVRGIAAFLSRITISFFTRRARHGTLLVASMFGAAVALGGATALIQIMLVSGFLFAVSGFLLGLGQPLTMTLISTGVPRPWRSQALTVRLVGNRIGQIAFPLAGGAVAGPLGPAVAIWLTCIFLMISVSEQFISRAARMPRGEASR